MDFAGHRIFACGGKLRSRVLNPNVEYEECGVDKLRLEKTRYVAGASFCSQAAKKGQAFGHFIRVVDASNHDSTEWLAYDLFYVAFELFCAGWSPRLLLGALKRVLADCPALESSVSLASRWLLRCSRCASSSGPLA